MTQTKRVIIDYDPDDPPYFDDAPFPKGSNPAFQIHS